MDKFKQLLKSWFIPGTENDYRPHILRKKAILIFAIFVLLVKLIIFGFFSFLPYTAEFSTITTNRLIELTNQSREAAGLPPLAINNKLSQSAYLKAEDMVEKDYFNHTNPEGLTPWYWFKQANYNYQYAGENLAMDFFDAENLYQAWFNSSNHKANLLNPNYKEIGIAIISGEFNGKQTTIAVQHFGTEFEKPSLAAGEPKQEPKTTTLPLAELEKNNLAASRKTDKEPILTPKEEKIEEQVAALTQEKIKEFERFATNIQTKKGPKVLGILVEKSDEITKHIYLYALIFIALALFLNIFIKFEVQHRKLIINGILIILLIIALMLINGKEILNAGLNII